MNDSNYVVIQGWMCNELKLKGNDLLIFALIHGFSQDDVNYFEGSRSYISETFNISKPTVDSSIKRLINSGLIEKEATNIQGFILNRYKAVVNNRNRESRLWGSKETLGVVKKFEGGSKETLPGGSKETLPGVVKKLYPIYISNTDNNNTDSNTDRDIVVQNTTPPKPYKEIVDYLNLRSGKNFSHKTKATQSHINARLAEGYSVQDFKDVIDKKCIEWSGDASMAQYLRPSTLFGTKFESYLNQNVVDTTAPKKQRSWTFSDLLNE